MLARLSMHKMHIADLENSRIHGHNGLGYTQLILSITNLKALQPPILHILGKFCKQICFVSKPNNMMIRSSDLLL